MKRSAFLRSLVAVPAALVAASKAAAELIPVPQLGNYSSWESPPTVVFIVDILEAELGYRPAVVTFKRAAEWDQNQRFVISAKSRLGTFHSKGLAVPGTLGRRDFNRELVHEVTKRAKEMARDMRHTEKQVLHGLRYRAPVAQVGSYL